MPRKHLFQSNPKASGAIRHFKCQEGPSIIIRSQNVAKLSPITYGGVRDIHNLLFRTLADKKTKIKKKEAGNGPIF